MRASHHPRKDGFTLVELLVVLAVIGAFGFLLAPALTSSRPNLQALQCLNNHRQLCNAWRMYADDNRGNLVYASDDGSGAASNPYAWTLSHLDFSGNNAQNWDVNADIAKRPLWPYSGKNAQIYKCPADSSFVTVNGVQKPRVRSVSMNLFLGGFNGNDGGFPSADPFKIFFKFSEIGASCLGTAKTFVFLDMRPDSINWGNFFTDMTGSLPSNPALYQFQEFPGMYHHDGCTFSFADGHGEIHRWLDPRTTPAPVLFGPSQQVASPRNVDIAWLQNHSTCPK